jgi:hypothetical protein
MDLYRGKETEVVKTLKEQGTSGGYFLWMLDQILLQQSVQSA